MNQLFYNLAGGIVHQIRRESKVIVRGKRNKQNRNWFYFNLSFESSSFIFNNFKTEKFKLTFEGWNRPVCNLFSFTRVSFCQNCISPSNSEANRDGADAGSPFPLFFSFSASFKNSSPREKVGNCLRFGTGGWSLCFYPLLSRNIWIFFPTLTMAARAKKKFWQRDLLTPSARECTIEIWSTGTLLNLIAWLC